MASYKVKVVLYVLVKGCFLIRKYILKGKTENAASSLFGNTIETNLMQTAGYSKF